MVAKTKKSTLQKKSVSIHTIPEANPKVEVIDYYNDLMSSMQYPVTVNFLIRLGENWKLWARDCTTAMNASTYILDAGIHWGTAMSWTKRHPSFLEDYEAVKKFISNRREQKYIETGSNALAFMMPHYDEDYKAQHVFRASLRSQEMSQDKRPIIVNIPDFTKSPDRAQTEKEQL